jgi:hypothetical protein
MEVVEWRTFSASSTYKAMFIGQSYILGAKELGRRKHRANVVSLHGSCSAIVGHSRDFSTTDFKTVVPVPFALNAMNTSII